jgi:hypothetical protein
LSFTAFDPRNSIRDKIGTDWDVEEDGTTVKCITITDNRNDPLYIPMYFSERIKSENLPSMPYIEMQIKKTYYSPADVAAAVRKKECYIDLHLYITDTDNIDREVCGKKVKDFLQNAIRVNQSCSFTNVDWINVDSDDYLPETTGSQLVYHYIMTIYVQYSDICS